LLAMKPAMRPRTSQPMIDMGSISIPERCAADLSPPSC
jgi:hypothetical protein